MGKKVIAAVLVISFTVGISATMVGAKEKPIKERITISLRSSVDPNEPPVD